MGGVFTRLHPTQLLHPWIVLEESFTTHGCVSVSGVLLPLDTIPQAPYQQYSSLIVRRIHRSHIAMQGMSPWTKVLDGRKSADTTPLLPNSEHPDLTREQDSSASGAASSAPVNDFPDPVKPGHEALHDSYHGYPVWHTCHYPNARGMFQNGSELTQPVWRRTSHFAYLQVCQLHQQTSHAVNKVPMQQSPVQAIGVEPPPVYAGGDFVTGHPVLPQATEPPAPGHSQLVTNERRIVQQPMKGNAVIVSCHQCGHVGPALVTKVICHTCVHPEPFSCSRLPSHQCCHQMTDSASGFLWQERSSAAGLPAVVLYSSLGMMGVWRPGSHAITLRRY